MLQNTKCSVECQDVLIQFIQMKITVSEKL